MWTLKPAFRQQFIRENKREKERYWFDVRCAYLSKIRLETRRYLLTPFHQRPLLLLLFLLLMLIVWILFSVLLAWFTRRELHCYLLGSKWNGQKNNMDHVHIALQYCDFIFFLFRFWPWSHTDIIFAGRAPAYAQKAYSFRTRILKLSIALFRKHYERAFCRGIRCWWTIEKWNVYHFSVLISLGTECICFGKKTIFIKTKFLLVYERCCMYVSVSVCVSACVRVDAVPRINSQFGIDQSNNVNEFSMRVS